MSQHSVLFTTRHCLATDRDRAWRLLSWPSLIQRWMPLGTRIEQRSGLPGEAQSRQLWSLDGGHWAVSVSRSEALVQLHREGAIGPWHYSESLWLLAINSGRTDLHAHLRAAPAREHWLQRWRQPPLPALLAPGRYARLVQMVAAGDFDRADAGRGAHRRRAHSH